MRFAIALLILVTAGVIGFSALAVGLSVQNGQVGLAVFWFILAVWNGVNLGGLVSALREW